jgi:hypothetical protein
LIRLNGTHTGTEIESQQHGSQGLQHGSHSVTHKLSLYFFGGQQGLHGLQGLQHGSFTILNFFTQHGVHGSQDSYVILSIFGFPHESYIIS